MSGPVGSKNMSEFREVPFLFPEHKRVKTDRKLPCPGGCDKKFDCVKSIKKHMVFKHKLSEADAKTTGDTFKLRLKYAAAQKRTLELLDNVDKTKQLFLCVKCTDCVSVAASKLKFNEHTLKNHGSRERRGYDIAPIIVSHEEATTLANTSFEQIAMAIRSLAPDLFDDQPAAAAAAALPVASPIVAPAVPAVPRILTSAEMLAAAALSILSGSNA